MAWISRILSRPKKDEPASAGSASAHNGVADVDLKDIDAIVEAQGGKAASLVPILQAIQGRYRYLPQEALKHLAASTGISAAEIAGVSTFYSQFRHRPVGRHLVRVCHGTACHVAGAPLITEALRRHVGIEDPKEDTDAERRFTIEKVPCLGCCSLAPCMTVDGVTYGRLTPHQACAVLDDVERAESS